MVDDMTPALVAVIEDDEPSRIAMGRLLSAAGFEPALFDCAETFMATPAQGLLCIILDVQLTGMSGIDFLHRLRASGSTLPVIVTTGNREAVIRDRAERHGCTAFLPKPVCATTLLSTVGTIARTANA